MPYLRLNLVFNHIMQKKFLDYLLYIVTTLIYLKAVTPICQAMPNGPDVFCTFYVDAPRCKNQAISCSTCHLGQPPRKNSYGKQIAQYLLPNAPRPLTKQTFAKGLSSALKQIEELDADNDGISNLKEILAATFPGHAQSTPAQIPHRPYNPAYAFKKIFLDFCGRSPSYKEMTIFRSLNNKRQAIHETLNACLDSEFWIGQDGQVWQLAHTKIRPLAAVKAGKRAGPVPLANYDHAYALWVYTQIDHHDARDALLAQYYVKYKSKPSRYIPVNNIGRAPAEPENITKERRAGILTTRWYLVANTMFTAVPRTTAAQTFRAFLNMDISKMEGISPIHAEPKDYDAKGVAEPECAMCHSTLDPLAYVFKNYHGLTKPEGTYVATRIEDSFAHESDRITQMPESGFIFGQAVDNLRQWAEIAANSNAFASAMVTDYWKLLMGSAPNNDELLIFQKLWQDFKAVHNYSVEKMLHDLVDTEVYGAP